MVTINTTGIGTVMEGKAMCESDQIIEELVSLMVSNADPHSTEEAYNLGLEDAIEKIKEYSS